MGFSKPGPTVHRSEDIKSEYREYLTLAPVASQAEITLLDKIRAIVLARPPRLFMGDWHSYEWDASHTPEEEQTCGSSHCIAGWAQALSGERYREHSNALAVGDTLLPSARCMFFVDDDEYVLEWFDRRIYAEPRIPQQEETYRG